MNSRLHKLLGAAAMASAMFVLSSCAQSTQPQTESTLRPGPSQGVSQENIQFDAEVYNSCCGETVDLSGIEHIVANSDYSHIHINLKNLVGTGSSGDTYHGTLYAEETTNYNNNNSGAEATLIEHLVMTSNTGCQFKLTIKEHVTIDANGNTRVDSFEYTTECL